MRVYDDYAHHPTEIAASLDGGPGRGRPGRPADRGLPARHLQPDPDVRPRVRRRPGASPTWPWSWTSSLRARSRSRASRGRPSATLVPLPAPDVVYEPSYAAVPARVADIARPGDLVLTMGIGNVYLLCPEIREACARTPGPGRCRNEPRPRCCAPDRPAIPWTRRRGGRGTAWRRGHGSPLRSSSRCCSARWCSSAPFSAPGRSQSSGTSRLTAAQVRSAARIALGHAAAAVGHLGRGPPDRGAARGGQREGTHRPTRRPCTSPSSSGPRVGYLPERCRIRCWSTRRATSSRSQRARPVHLPLFVVPAGADAAARATGRAVASVAAAAAGLGAVARWPRSRRSIPGRSRSLLTDHRVVQWGSADRNADKAADPAAPCCGQPGTRFDLSDPDQAYRALIRGRVARRASRSPAGRV